MTSTHKDFTGRHITVSSKAPDAPKKRKPEDSGPLAYAAKVTAHIKTLVTVLVGFASVVALGAITFVELRNKPTKDQVSDQISRRVEPVQLRLDEGTSARRKMSSDIKRVRSDVDKLERVQRLILEQGMWHGEVLQHIADDRKGPTPPEPESLKEAKREVMLR